MQILGNVERVTGALNKLYQAYGYQRFKVSKFEEYDLYMQNKNFLTSRQILTFTNTDGKLMALKPDVTLSIVKNTQPGAGTRKLYYTEQVYRATDVDYGFREITQTGLELIGDVDLYATSEVVMLAARSLSEISAEYILDLSHIGIISGVLEYARAGDDARGNILRAIGQKNAHELRAALRIEKLPPSAANALLRLSDICGPADEALSKVEKLELPPASICALNELRGVVSALGAAGAGERVYLDFSIVNDMDYYNGIYFRGFVAGLPAAVLAGGRYDKLLERMGRACGAIGFAVYLDQLERLPEARAPYDVDRLIIYERNANAREVIKLAAESVNMGLSVRVQTNDAGDITYKEKIILGGEGATI